MGVLLVANVTRWGDKLDNPVEDRQRVKLFYTIADWVSEHTRPRDVLLFRQAPILSYLTGRTAYSTRFASADALVDKYRVDYAIFVGEDRGQLNSVRSRATETWTLDEKPETVTICQMPPPRRKGRGRRGASRQSEPDTPQPEPEQDQRPR
jgi:hypothetical protein